MILEKEETEEVKLSLLPGEKASAEKEESRQSTTVSLTEETKLEDQRDIFALAERRIY